MVSQSFSQGLAVHANKSLHYSQHHTKTEFKKKPLINSVILIRCLLIETKVHVKNTNEDVLRKVQ